MSRFWSGGYGFLVQSSMAVMLGEGARFSGGGEVVLVVVDGDKFVGPSPSIYRCT